MDSEKNIQNIFIRDSRDSNVLELCEDMQLPLSKCTINTLFYQSESLGSEHRTIKKRPNIQAYWITRGMSMFSDNREQHIKINLIEFTVYIMFVLLLTSVVFFSHHDQHFILTKVLKKNFIETSFRTRHDVFINFNEIRCIDDIFNWFKHVFIPTIYSDVWYHDGQGKYKIHAEVNDSNCLYENYLLGSVALQTIDVNSTECRIHPKLPKYIYQCHGYFSIGNINKNVRFFREPNSKNGGHDITYGQFHNYPIYGSVVDLPAGSDNALTQLINLKETGWIKEHTRVIIAHVNLYNININAFAFIKFIFEIPPTGGVYTSFNIQIANLIRYISNFHFIILGIETSLLCFILYFTFEEIREILFFGKAYLLFAWNIVDLIICAFMITTLFHTVMMAFLNLNFSSNLTKKLQQIKEKKFISFNDVSQQSLLFTEIITPILMVIVWIKVLRYMVFSQKMEQIAKVFNECMGHLFQLSLIMIIFFVGFALSGRLVFGHIVKEYSTIFETVCTLIRIFAGDFQYKNLCEADGLLGPIFLGGYIFIMYFILANVAIAIINEAFQKTVFEQKSDELTTKSFLKRAYYNLFCRCLKTVKKPEHSNDITYNEIYALLKRANFNNEEIIMFLSKYEIFPDTPLPRYIKTVKKKLELLSFQPTIPITQTAVSRCIKYKRNSAEFHILTKDEYEDLQAQLNHIDLLIDLSTEQIAKLHEEFAHVITDGSDECSNQASLPSSLNL